MQDKPSSSPLAIALHRNAVQVADSISWSTNPINCMLGSCRQVHHLYLALLSADVKLESISMTCPNLNVAKHPGSAIRHSDQNIKCLVLLLWGGVTQQ